MKRVIIESPYRGANQAERLRNVGYLNKCIRDCLMRGESPYASHGLLPGALDEDDPKERLLGIESGYIWWEAAEVVLFYIDFGWSVGMLDAQQQCKLLNKSLEERSLKVRYCWVKSENCINEHCSYECGLSPR